MGDSKLGSGERQLAVIANASLQVTGNFVTCPYLGILVSHEGYDEGDDVAAVVEVRVGHQEVAQAPDADLLQALATQAEEKETKRQI